jgi:hypothetical protein
MLNEADIFQDKKHSDISWLFDALIIDSFKKLVEVSWKIKLWATKLLRFLNELYERRAPCRNMKKKEDIQRITYYVKKGDKWCFKESYLLSQTSETSCRPSLLGAKEVRVRWSDWIVYRFCFHCQVSINCHIITRNEITCRKFPVVVSDKYFLDN